MDDKFKSDLSSMKSAKIMDGKFKMKFPSMKKPEIMDEKFKMKLSSMKSAENVDEKMQTRPLVHEKAPKVSRSGTFGAYCLIYGRWRQSYL